MNLPHLDLQKQPSKSEHEFEEKNADEELFEPSHHAFQQILSKEGIEVNHKHAEDYKLGLNTQAGMLSELDITATVGKPEVDIPVPH